MGGADAELGDTGDPPAEQCQVRSFKAADIANVTVFGIAAPHAVDGSDRE